MMYYCVCSAGGSGQVVERSTDPTPSEAIQWSGPYNTFEEAVLYCEGTTCPQGYWCVCGRKTTSGLAKVVYYPSPPEWFKYQIHSGPFNTPEQAKQVCIDPVENTNPVEYKYKTCKYVTTSPAVDICKPDSTLGVPVTLECSLACTPLGYPMTGGVCSINFITSDCVTAEPKRSRWIDRVLAVGLSCINADPVVDGTWVGELITDVGAPGVPNKGFTMRLRTVMTVLDANTIQIQLNIFRLVPGSEQSPPSDLNSWSMCGGAVVKCYRQLPPGADINDRTINWTFASQLIPYVMGGDCATDVRYISLGVTLTPWRFGCDGTANAGAKADCSLASGNYSYSCFTVSIKPTTTYNALYQGPVFSQLGVNDPNCESSGAVCGCYTGYLTFPWGGVTVPFTPQPMQALITGCDGETFGAQQSFQFGRQGGYDVIIKSVNKGSLCIAVRQTTDTGGAWTVAGKGDSTLETYASTDHIINRAYFPSIVGKPEIILYGLKFPNPEITGCIHNLDPLPAAWPPPPSDALVRNSSLAPVKYSDNASAYLHWGTSVSLATPMMEDANNLVAQIKTRYNLKCIHLGEEIPNTGCCGSSNLFKCNVYDQCRRYGMSKNGEPVCGTCISFEG